MKLTALLVVASACVANAFMPAVRLGQLCSAAFVGVSSLGSNLSPFDFGSGALQGLHSVSVAAPGEPLL
jgi:hypothetical protein